MTFKYQSQIKISSLHLLLGLSNLINADSKYNVLVILVRLRSDMNSDDKIGFQLTADYDYQ